MLPVQITVFWCIDSLRTTPPRIKITTTTRAPDWTQTSATHEGIPYTNGSLHDHKIDGEGHIGPKRILIMENIVNEVVNSLDELHCTCIYQETIKLL